MFFSPPFSSFLLSSRFIALNKIFQPLMSTLDVGSLALNVTVFIEPFNLACCEASNRITHFTLTTRYDESITR